MKRLEKDLNQVTNLLNDKIVNKKVDIKKLLKEAEKLKSDLKFFVTEKDLRNAKNEDRL